MVNPRSVRIMEGDWGETATIKGVEVGEMEMTQSELLDRILALPIADRWHLVQALLNSIQAETTGSHGETNGASSTAESELSLQRLRNSSEAAAVLAQALTDSKGEKHDLSSDGFGFLPQRIDPLVFQKQLRQEWDD